MQTMSRLPIPSRSRDGEGGLSVMGKTIKGTSAESTGAVAYANHVARGRAQEDSWPRHPEHSRRAPRNDRIAIWYNPVK